MKTLKSLFLITFLFTRAAIAQIPDGFSYQAIARDAGGALLANQDIEVEVRILSGSENGTLLWRELHQTRTSDLGMISLVICGNNQLRTGGEAPTIHEIPWASGNTYIGLKLTTGEGEVDLGASAIRSVPYSLLSAATIEKSNTLSIQPSEQMAEGEALFIVKRSDGYPIFAVYESGVHVFTDTVSTDGKGIKGGFAVGGYKKSAKSGLGQTFLSVTPDSTRINVNTMPAKGLKGGFAVGGYTSAKGSQPLTLLTLSRDSARIYLDDLPDKGAKGGFAVGGYHSSKGVTREYMRVTQDSMRVYLNTDKNNKGLKGGFAVGGYSSRKSGQTTFMTLEPENYFIGHNSGSKITTGLYNSVMGYESGPNITEGNSNSFIGYQSGYRNQTGTGNLFLGYQSGYSNLQGNYNTFVGYRAGYENYQGVNNTLLGSFSGQNNVDGSFNTFVGDSTGFSNTYGYSNTFMGTAAGYSNTTGYSNVIVGTKAGYRNNTGGFNVFIGHLAGYENVDAGSNVYIGTEAGKSSKEGWNNIYMGTGAGFHNLDGEGNVMMGFEAGYFNEHGTRNVFIGNRAGYNETGTGKLYINDSNADSTYSLIWGDFIQRQLRFNAEVDVFSKFGAGSVTIGGLGDIFDYGRLIFRADSSLQKAHYSLAFTKNNTFQIGYVNENYEYFPRLKVDATGNISINNTWDAATEMLDVNGNARFRGVGSATAANDLRITADGTLTTSTSDARLKMAFRPITGSLGKVLKLQGWYFRWNAETGGIANTAAVINADGVPDAGGTSDFLESREEIGLLAQDVAEIFPEAVFVNPVDGYMGINYSRFPAILIEAIKEQQQIIEDQKQQLVSQDSRLLEQQKQIQSQESWLREQQVQIQSQGLRLEAQQMQMLSQESRLEAQQQQIDQQKLILESLLEKTDNQNQGRH